jgi:hypothetical protein
VLYTLSAVTFQGLNARLYLSMNSKTFLLLNAVVFNRLVYSGLQSVRILCFS